MSKEITGQNVLTVLLSKPEQARQLKMFFCPYTRNITTQYQGEVTAIFPGYDPDETPQVMIRPQRLQHSANIFYSFISSGQNGDGVDFWIQDQYFDDIPIKTYHCFNCQAPQLYFSNNKVVLFQNKSDIKKGESYICSNPFCKESLTYRGMVKIKPVNNAII